MNWQNSLFVDLEFLIAKHQAGQSSEQKPQRVAFAALCSFCG